MHICSYIIYANDEWRAIAPRQTVTFYINLCVRVSYSVECQKYSDRWSIRYGSNPVHSQYYFPSIHPGLREISLSQNQLLLVT